MNTLTKCQAKKADHFLRQLCDSKDNMNQEKIYKSFDDNILEANDICAYINSRGLINITDCSGDKSLYCITPKNDVCLFIKNGGFTKEFKLNNSERRWKRAPIIISCISLIFVGFSLYKNWHSDQKISNFETEISKHDSLIITNQNKILQTQKDIQYLTDSLILLE